MTKSCTLRAHQRKANDKDLLISSRDFPDYKIGDVLEIYHPEDDLGRVLLKVEDLSGSADNLKDTISIEEGIINRFHLKPFKNVHVRKVPTADVTVDLVVLICKDIYLCRSDMWQLKMNMEGQCVYLMKKVAFHDQNPQISVSEIWAHGEKWTCGLVTESTKVCFRSMTACMNIFIQMSSEMWEYDSFGDLYFEKAVGFLRELFSKWKKEECLHDVTIVLFSRTFYDAVLIDEFPLSMRGGIQTDYMGRFYEDFYRILVQNERYDEWTSSLVKLKRVFIDYTRTVLCCHHGDERLPRVTDSLSKVGGSKIKIPAGSNSSAALGNFLEVMNMSLNVYEKYYIDRNFDRLGKISVIITPGPGVFEVDRKLMTITKQRTIDSGCAADLICMGEQPLHAVPLFKFHRAPTDQGPDDYSIPHWINHSFYTSQSQIRVTSTSQFIPRIKIAGKKASFKGDEAADLVTFGGSRPSLMTEATTSNDVHGGWMAPKSGSLAEVDYDLYDSAVFSYSGHKIGRQRSMMPNASGSLKKPVPQTQAEALQQKAPRRRGTSDNYPSAALERVGTGEIALGNVKARTSGSAVNFNKSLSTAVPEVGSLERLNDFASKGSPGSNESEDQFNDRTFVGSAEIGGWKMKGFLAGHANKALINPFAPSYIRFRMTSNRRRWAHAFPLDKQGQTIQPHHQHSEVGGALYMSSKLMLASSSNKIQVFRRVSTEPHLLRRQDSTSSVVMAGETSMAAPQSHRQRTISNDSLDESVYFSPSMAVGSQGESSSLATASDPSAWDAGWGVAGDTEWSPMITTGVDWRSLTRPALLPITTDYFPDKQSFLKDYIVASNYTLEADSSNDTGESDASALASRYFKELVNTRIALGFQLILLPQKTVHEDGGSGSSCSTDKTFDKSLAAAHGHVATLSRSRPRVQKETYNLSIGRIFHELTKCENVITVTVQRPKTQSKPKPPFSYKYQFMCPDEDRYAVSWTEYATEQLEEYSWNYLDNYIITRGDDQEHNLIESLKYWRARFFLLPNNNPGVKACMDSLQAAGKTKPPPPLDVFTERPLVERSKSCEEFLKFIEFVNKVKRPLAAVASVGRVKVDKTASFDNATHLMDYPAAPELGGNRARAVPDLVATVSTPQHSLVDAAFDVSSVDVMKLADSFCHPDGLQFVKHDKLPSNTFIAAEACAWVVKNVPLIKTQRHSVQLLQHMAKQGIIRHVSGNPTVVFNYGVHLFYVRSVLLSSDGGASGSGVTHRELAADIRKTWIEVTVAQEDELDDAAMSGAMALSLQNDLAEGVVGNGNGSPNTSAAAPPTLKKDLLLSGRKTQPSAAATNHQYPMHRNATVEIDSGEKSGRVEWASVRHDTSYHPQCAFDLEINWIVSTGVLLAELIKVWSKKATSFGFQLLPTAVDPFAMPQNKNSDPLRGPIFVPLSVGNLEHMNTSDGNRKELDGECLNDLKQAIIKRYGFVPVSWDPKRGSGCGSGGRDFYVHCGGGMYLTPGSAGSPRKEGDVGFTWSWNFMLSKRWRSNGTGDEAFQDAMLADFRAFCAGKDGRLQSVYTAVLSERKTKANS